MEEKEIKYKVNIQNKILVYDVLRVMTTLLVIISHCGYYNIISKYGGIRYGELLSKTYLDSTVHSVFLLIVNFIYSFHMQLFMGLSGALFFIQFKQNKFSNIKELGVNKFKRLIVPFFAITIFYSIPLKYVSGYFEGIDLVKNMVIGQILIQGNTYLWFLPTLFMCFIFSYVVEKYMNIDKKYKIVIYIILNLMSSILSINIIKYTFRFILWFYMGYLFEQKRENINLKIESNKNIWIGIAWIVITMYFIGNIEALNKFILYKIISKVILLIESGFSCFFMYIISFKISKRIKIINSIYYKNLLVTSFGLYLYSDPLNYLILFLIYKLRGIRFFSLEVGALVIIFLRISITLGGAYLITRVLKQRGYKYVA